MRAAPPKSATAPRTRRSAEALRVRIIEAAAEEFAQIGYAATTTAAIARKAGVTEAQLFRYFRSKSNLFREAVFKPLEAHLRHFTETHLPEHGNRESIRQNTALYIEELQKFIAGNAEAITSLVVAQTYDAASGHGVGAIASLTKYFERGASVMQGHGARDPQVRPELMVRVSFAAVLACVMFRDWIFPETLADEAEIKRAINDFVLHGISINF